MGIFNQKPIKTIYIFNMSEDVWPFISEISKTQDREYEIQENSRLSDRDLLSFSGEDNIIMVLPSEPNPDFLNYYYELFDKQNFRILVPKIHTGEICKDVLNDQNVLNTIIEAANSTRKINLIAYTTSWQFLDLVDFLRSKGITVNTPESPTEADAWTVNFFGSKSGIRQLAQQGEADEPDLKMGDGLIISGIIDAAKIASIMYVKNHGIVLKTNKGHSGAGLLIFRDKDLPNQYQACEQKILTELRKEKYWSKFPIVVEELINPQPNIGGGYPNVEFKILRNGHIEFLYFCGMRVSPEGVFKGVEINNEALSDRVSARLVDTGFFIGERLAEEGYVGYYDVDFVATKNNEFFVTESNVRRTGGTHVYHTAMHLFGKDFMIQAYILSNNNYKLKEGIKMTFNDLRQKLTPVLYDKTSQEGLIFASANILALNMFAYIIFGKNKKRALEIEAKMEQLLR